MSSLLANARPHLEQVLDCSEDGVEKDLIEIAHYMLDWEELLISHLKLTDVDRSDIKEIYPNKPVTTRPVGSQAV